MEGAALVEDVRLWGQRASGALDLPAWNVKD
jgi:hypothetical protein